MSITLLDLYNMVASQSWSMFDNDAENKNDFNPALLSAINKALVEIWCSYPFPFRRKEITITTQTALNEYNLPDGIIEQKITKSGEKYAVKTGRNFLDFIEYPEDLEFVAGKPEGFFINNDKLSFYPVPDGVYNIKICYHTFSVGIDSSLQPIYALVDADDVIVIPDEYKQLFLNALCAKSMMYALTSPRDENYAGYAILFEKAYKLLIRAVGGRKKNRKVVF